MFSSCIPPEYLQQSQQIQEQEQEQQIFPEGSRRSNGVRWIEVHTEKEFRQQIYSAPKVTVLFSTPWCDNCKVVKLYWENQSAPPDWNFVYWGSKDNNEYEKKQLPIIKRFATKAGRLPFMFAAKDARRQKDETLTTAYEVFFGIDECTLSLKKWLSVH